MTQRLSFSAIALILAASLPLGACTTAEPALVGLAPEPAAIAASADGEAVPVADEGAVMDDSSELIAYADPETETESLVGYSGGGGRERNCLMRAMYFESNRSSKAGLLAVGTVVMNRVQSGKFPRTVCGVVGQRGQFAPGVLRRKMRGDLTDLTALADSILAGKRHPGVRKAMHFHQQGLRFPYRNMHYVLNAGGNSFYEKRSRKKRRR